MGFKPRDQARKQKVKDGDTLETLAQAAKVSWEVLAGYNWGTTDPNLIGRALFECLGCETRPKDPKTHKFTGKEARNGSGEILIPEAWSQSGCNLDKLYTIKLRKIPPAPIVSFAKLDKWFIPGTETCHIGYRLEGSAHSADKLGLDVFGSNYCECTAWNKGLGTYEKLDDNPPLFSQAEGNPAEPGKSHKIKVDGKDGWNGKVNPAKGILARKTDGRDRFINVAFSPYTVLLRFYKADKDKDARIVLHPFWPQWEREEKTPEVKAEIDDAQIKLKWKNEAQADEAVLEIYDTNSQRVYMESLTAQLGKGDQEFAWNLGYLGRLSKTYRCYAVNSQAGKEYLPRTRLETAFDNTGSLTGNLRIHWDVADAAGLQSGRLVITDRTGKTVYAHDLTGGQRASGARQHDWNGTYSTGTNSKAGNKAILDDAPYQVRIKGVSAKTGDVDMKGDGPYTFRVTTINNKIKAESLKAHWEFKNLDKADRLACGLLQILDKSDKPVFEKALNKDLVGTDPEKTQLTWDGKYSPGLKNSRDGTEIIPADMPYRLQIQVHTGPGEENGLAMAAMHIEVRLYVHPDTHAPRHPAHDPWREAPSLRLGLGTFVPEPAKVPADPPAGPDTKKRKWFQYHLAESGFHAGPVNGANHAAYSMAMREFQRSVPKQKTGADFERQTVSGTENDDAKNAIKAMTDDYRRPWFGDPAGNKKSLPHKDEDDRDKISAILRDNKKELIVWVDARHYYTHSRTAENQAIIEATIGDYHGEMQVGDQLVETYDQTIVPRPWIPIQVALPLLSKDTIGLDQEQAFDEEDDDAAEAMRRALGPLSIAWSFDEVGLDLEPIDTGKYDASRVRTRDYALWALNKFAESYERKDTGRKSRYTNCPADLGGIRPGPAPLAGTVADYYKLAFGFGDQGSLDPWHAVAIDTDEVVATVAHDHLCATQPKEDEPLIKSKIGLAGIHFQPSRTAGDGYRISARVRFKKIGGTYEFPNLETLDQRYPRPPQAHSTRLRLWRKSSIRGYLRWTPANNAGHINGLRELYQAAHVDFVDELGQADGGGKPNVPAFRPRDLVDTASNPDYTAYKTIITDRAAQDYHKNRPNLIKLDNDHCFPWYDENNLGWPWPSEPNVAFARVRDLVNEVESNTWSRIQEGVLLDMIRRVEKKHGRLRGHLLAHFVDTNTVYTEKYICDACANHYWFLEKTNAGGNAEGKACSCGGHMRRTGKCTGRYRCTNGHGLFDGPDDTFPGGGAYNGQACPTCGSPSLDCKSVNVTEARQAPQAVPTGTIVTYGIGDAGGGTWLCNTFKAWEWTHEVGHHRHLEHAAAAPVGSRTAEKDKLHDSQRNTAVNWTAAGVPDVLNQRWDRCCIMSYVDSSTGYSNPSGGGVDHTYFCGKCVLRNRGWKVESIVKGPDIAPDLPGIAVDAETHDFGNVNSGSTGDHTFQVSNPGADGLQISNTNITGGNGKFSITAGAAPFTVNAGGTHNIRVRFAPTDNQSCEATLALTSNVDPAAYPGKNPLDIKLKGNLPDISVNPGAHNFGNVDTGAHADHTFTVTNTGTGALKILPKIVGTDWTITSGGGLSTLNKNATKNITARFAPTTAGAKAATLSIDNNVAGKSPRTVNLTGTGKIP